MLGDPDGALEACEFSRTLASLDVEACDTGRISGAALFPRPLPQLLKGMVYPPTRSRS